MHYGTVVYTIMERRHSGPNAEMKLDSDERENRPIV